MIRDLLFPDSIYCGSCGAVIDKTRPYGLCDACVRRFAWAGTKICGKCGRPLTDPIHPLCRDCRSTDHLFDRGITCTSYGLYERMLLSDYRNGKPWLARHMAEMLRDRFRLSDLSPDVLITRDEGMIPVAKHFSRLTGIPRGRKGRTVLLLTDVYRDGRKEDETAGQLKREGAEAVYVLSFTAAGDNLPKAW